MIISLFCFIEDEDYIYLFILIQYFFSEINNIVFIYYLGIGLGLDVSKRLIRLITREDSLSVCSEQNQGTKIAFKMLLNYEINL